MYEQIFLYIAIILFCVTIAQIIIKGFNKYSLTDDTKKSLIMGGMGILSFFTGKSSKQARIKQDRNNVLEGLCLDNPEHPKCVGINDTNITTTELSPLLEEGEKSPGILEKSYSSSIPPTKYSKSSTSTPNREITDSELYEIGELDQNELSQLDELRELESKNETSLESSKKEKLHILRKKFQPLKEKLKSMKISIQLYRDYCKKSSAKGDPKCKLKNIHNYLIQ